LFCFLGIGGIVDHYWLSFLFLSETECRIGRDHMVVGFATTCAISACHH